MADEIDRAQAHNEYFQNEMLQRQLRSSEARPSRSHCVDCDDQIPLSRQQALPGVQRCIGCQQTLENWRPL